MKKLLIIGLFAAGCASAPATPTTSIRAEYVAPTPAPAPAEIPAPAAKNPYKDVVSALYGLSQTKYVDFEDFCTEAGGNFNVVEGVATCLDNNATGFAVRYAPGKILGAAIIVAGEDGELLAEAVVEEVGKPNSISGTAAVWQFQEFTLTMTPMVEHDRWLLVLEHVED